MVVELPSIALLLGKTTESVSRVASQLENIGVYCDSSSHSVIKNYLLEHSEVERKLSSQQKQDLATQIKRACHLVMEQIFYKLETGTQIHLTEVTPKGNTYGTHLMRYCRLSGEIEYGIAGTAGEERRATILSQSVSLNRFQKIQQGIPSSGFDREHVMKNLSEFGLKIPLEEYSFTLFTDSGAKKENFSGVEKLVLSFTNEADFSAWYDALQMKVKDVISVYHLDFSPYSLYQIYSVLAINHGISLIEKELITFQPVVPPLPPGPEHYTVVDSTKTINFSLERRETRERRNTSWIEDSVMHMGQDGDDDFDLDLDSIVDAKLSQLSKDAVASLGNSNSPRKTITSPRETKGTSGNNSPRRSMTNPVSPRSQPSWIRSQEAIKPRGQRKALLSRKLN